MTELEQQVAYAVWRFNTWVEGYGSYDDIDAAVRAGRLTPGKPWENR